jgi:hypothetical protein
MDIHVEAQPTPLCIRKAKPWLLRSQQYPVTTGMASAQPALQVAEDCVLHSSFTDLVCE